MVLSYDLDDKMLEVFRIATEWYRIEKYFGLQMNCKDRITVERASTVIFLLHIFS